MDLGRYYNIWHPAMPAMWSGHSALFEVAMCVMAYLTVLYIELMPVVVERFAGRVRLPGPLGFLDGAVEGALRLFDRTLGRVMSVFIVLGVVLSTLHQSSLGTLMLLAPSKMNPLWWTPILPLLFLLSAIAVGFSMVIFESMIAARVFGRRPEMEVAGAAVADHPGAALRLPRVQGGRRADPRRRGRVCSTAASPRLMFLARGRRRGGGSAA